MLHHLGKKIFRLSDLTLHGNFHFYALKSAEQPPWEVISMRVTIVATSPISYNSCRNRHCPKCQGRKNREDWIQAREAELLLVPYFSLGIYFADSINALAIHNPKLSMVFCLRPFGKP